MKIVVTAGGTMGHINPALAIIEEFKKNESDLEVLYIGTHNRMEKEIIPKKDIPYEEIEIYGFSKDIFLDLKNIFLIQKAIKKCKKILLDFKPDVVIGVGGYVTYPVLKAAHELKIKTFIHEQNSIPGKSNKMISKYADLIGVTFEGSAKYFKTNGKIVLTGHPCGALAKNIPKKNKKDLGFSYDKPLLTVVAGSLGSGSLNEKMTSFLESLNSSDYEVCYITGKMHYEDFMKGKTFPSNVKILPYMEELPGLLKVSDVVISRAGAGSLSEILSLGIPSLIIPSPNVANNHQYYNAKELADKDCVILLEEKDLTVEKLKKYVDDLIHNEFLRMNLKNHMKKETALDSALLIYKEIKDLIK